MADDRLIANGLDPALGRALPILEALRLLQVLEGLAEFGLRIVELGMEVLGRLAEIVAPLPSRTGIGRVGEMVRVSDPGFLLFHSDLAIEISRHAVELGDHHLDLCNSPALVVDLKALEADERIPRLHL